MSFEIKKEKLWVKECAEKMKTEQGIETQITLPDYCGEIKKILKCALIPGIHSVSRTGERVSARGNVLLRVLYCAENDRIDCYEKNIDLAVSGQMKNITDDTVLTAKAETSYVNCRVSSPRKITVEGSVCVEFNGEKINKKEYPFAVESACVQVLNQEIENENTICIGEKTFDMAETVSLPSEKPPLGKLIHRNAYVILESKKAVSGKLLIKGECVTEIVYCPQDEKTGIERFSHSMPLSQIIDIDGIDDDMECNVRCVPSLLTVNSKNGSDDSGRLVEIALRISAQVWGTKKGKAKFICDCYCTDGEIESEYTLTDVLCPLTSFEKTETVKSVIDLSPQVKEICDIRISDIKTQMKGEGDKAKGVCNAVACVLYIDEKDEPSYAEKELEFLSEVPLKGTYESVKCDYDAFVKKAEWNSSGKGKAELSIEFIVNVKICSVNSVRILTDIKKAENENKSLRKPALTIYFCDDKEKVWNIAKKYRTTSEAVREENGIEGEEIKGARMLLIPSV